MLNLFQHPIKKNRFRIRQLTNGMTDPELKIDITYSEK